jgi:Rha family phage regulatory protein
METLVIQNKTGRDVTTSLIIAEIFGKEHSKVCRDINEMACSPEFNNANFGCIEYLDVRGRKQDAYEITKDGFSFLVMGYTGAKAGEFKEKFIAEFNKREYLLKNDDYIIERAMDVLRSRTRLLEAQLEAKGEQLRLQESVIKESAPKVMYFDTVLQSETAITTTIIAKDNGMSAESLNNLLHKKGIIYKMTGTWVLYGKYQDKGYTKSKVYTYVDGHGVTKTNTLTCWTELGRQFIHNILKDEKGTK